MKYILSICFLFFLIAAEAQEDTSKYIKYPNSYGPQYRDIWATRVMRLPDTTGHRPMTGAPGAIGRNTAGTALFIWDGSAWQAITGGGSSYQLPYNGNSAYYLGGDTLYHSLASGTSGGDTTIFNPVIDSTGQSAYRVLYGRGNNHIGSDPLFLYDSIHNKLVINAANFSIGGNNTKLYVNGNSTIGGNLLNNGNTTIRGTATISTTGAGAAGTDSVLVQSNGLVKKISPTYYGTGSSSGTVTSVATNTGSGITGGTITTTGTIAADTSILSTKAHVTDVLQGYVVRANNLSDVANANTSLNNLLPSQTSNSGKFLTTNGTNSSWGTPAGSGTLSHVYAPLITSGDTISQRFNVLHYGADNTGVTDATASIQAAINAASSAGVGVVWFPVGAYKISGALTASNCQLVIPSLTGTSRGHITLMGEGAPNMIPVGGGLPGSTLLPPTTGVRLISTLTTGAANAAVIGVESGSLTNTSIQNISIFVKNNPAGAGPVVGGIDFNNGVADVEVKNCTISIDTAGVVSTLPTNNIFGIRLPPDAQTQEYRITNTLVQGFNKGVVATEHAYFDGLNMFCCYYGLYLNTGTHASYGGRVCFQWNTNDIYFNGIVPLFISQFDEEYEYAGHSGGKWYDNIYTINDSLNKGKGMLFYKTTKSGAPFINHMVKNGGSGVNTYALYDSTAFALLNGNNIFTNGTNQYQFLRNPNFNSQNGFVWQNGTTNKFSLISNFNAGTSSLAVHDYTALKVRLYFDTTGRTSIGGVADVSTTAAVTFPSTGESIFNFNIGVGTTTPTTIASGTGIAGKILNVSNSSANSIIVSQGNGAGALLLVDNNATSGQRVFQISNTANKTLFRILNDAVTTVSFNPISVDNSNGFLGILNTSPVVALDVAGNVRANSVNVVKTGVQAGQTASQTICTYTTGGDSTYQIDAECIVNSVSGGTVKVSVTWTDLGNTSRTHDFFDQGSTTAAFSVTGISGYPPMMIRAKSGTTITVATTATATINYTANAQIVKVTN